MNRGQIEENILIFFQENNIQENFVRVRLRNGIIYDGFKVLFNESQYLIGLEESRMSNDFQNVFDCLVINKDEISEFFNPNQPV